MLWELVMHNITIIGESACVNTFDVFQNGLLRAAVREYTFNTQDGRKIFQTVIDSNGALKSGNSEAFRYFEHVDSLLKGYSIRVGDFIAQLEEGSNILKIFSIATLPRVDECGAETVLMAVFQNGLFVKGKKFLINYLKDAIEGVQEKARNAFD